VAGCVLSGELPFTALRGMLKIVALLTMLGLVHALLYDDFLWPNFALGLLTYSSVLVACVDFSSVASLHLLYRLFRLTFVFVAAQAGYGMVQSVYSAMVVGGGHFDDFIGDAVKGTINPTLVGDGLGSNQMFAILVSLFLFTLYPSRRFYLSRSGRMWFWTIGLSWLLASVMHTLFFGIVAVLVTAALFPTGEARDAVRRVSSRFRVMAYGLAAVAAVVVLLRAFLPGNLRNVGYYVGSTLTSFTAVTPISAKVVATLNTVQELPERVPEQPFVGLGLGQYSSRAGLIMSGTYLARGFFLEPRYREVSYDLIYSLQESIRDRNVGSTYFPYFSWLSLYGEFGWLGLVLVGWIVLRLVARLRRVSTPLHELRALGQTVMLCALYLMLLGLQDNYWEFTQAIFAPLVLLRLSYDTLRAYGQQRPAPAPN
jgi:hypothetical protein